MGIEKHVFHSMYKSSQFVFADGTLAVFVDGKYYTNDAKQIAELETACSSATSSISFDPNKRVVDMDSITPEAIIRAKVEKEVIAKMEAAKKMETMPPEAIAALSKIVVGSAPTK